VCSNEVLPIRMHILGRGNRPPERVTALTPRTAAQAGRGTPADPQAKNGGKGWLSSGDGWKEMLSSAVGPRSQREAFPLPWRKRNRLSFSWFGETQKFMLVPISPKEVYPQNAVAISRITKLCKGWENVAN